MCSHRKCVAAKKDWSGKDLVVYSEGSSLGLHLLWYFENSFTTTPGQKSVFVFVFLVVIPGGNLLFVCIATKTKPWKPMRASVVARKADSLRE